MPGGKQPEFCANSTSMPKIVSWLEAKKFKPRHRCCLWCDVAYGVIPIFIFHTLFHDIIY
jgi:hypothetical protein